ncbi:sulfate transporter CysZ [Alteromonadaceae bacterium M269]|nr:sulfate transporter CysZ [Alteromonadaceae bacterium M269]
MSQRSGFSYFMQGFSLIRTKGIKRFVLIPLMVNLILFSIAFTYLIKQVDIFIATLIDWIPNWLSWLTEWLSYFIWPLALITILLVFSYFFNTLANWIAAPFNGLLAEKIELHLRGKAIESGGWMDLIKDIPRTLGREFTKLLYYIPRAIGYLILFFLLPVVGQVIWFLFTAWMMAIQYCDYAFDNHKVPFPTMRKALQQETGTSIVFGSAVTLFAMVPVINFLVMPVAICGATAMWVEEFQPDLDE